MPYSVRQDGDKWSVVNTETDTVKAVHDSKEEAERQVKLLENMEKEWKES